jgi:integrase/recombinase XerD
MVLEDCFRRSSAITRIRLPPLGPLMDGFSDRLVAQQFSRPVIRQRIGQVSHFNQCLRRGGIEDWREVHGVHAERFLVRHPPHCRCRQGQQSGRAGIASTVQALQTYLSLMGSTALLPMPPATSSSPLLQHYFDYLRGEWQLAPTTCQTHRICLLPFLDVLGEPITERIAQLLPEQVLDFFTHQIRAGAPGLPQSLQSVLRSFLHYCRQEGYLERDLSGALPPIRSYRYAGVPGGISEEGARRTLNGIDRTTPLGRRDFAIILLLYTYGVRGGQVRGLRLQDIAWRDSRIRFPATKGGKEVLVPLTDEVGDSLLAYLRHARRPTSYPEVFLITHAPYHLLRSPSTVSVLVAQHELRSIYR